MEPTMGISVKIRNPVPLGAKKPSGAHDLLLRPARWSTWTSGPRSVAAGGGAMTDIGYSVR